MEGVRPRLQAVAVRAGARIRPANLAQELERVTASAVTGYDVLLAVLNVVQVIALAVIAQCQVERRRRVKRASRRRPPEG